MFWKRAEEKKEDSDDVREGMGIMPAIIGILMVLLAGFQLFYRYDSWPSKTTDGVVYERDRLTGELHVVLPGDKVSIVNRITGSYGHKPDEIVEGSQAAIITDRPQAMPIPEPSELRSLPVENVQAQYPSQPYYSQPYPTQAQQPYPAQVQQVAQQPYPNPVQQQGQTVVYPVAQPVIVTVPTPNQRQEREPQVIYRTVEARNPEPRQNEDRNLEARIAKIEQSVQDRKEASTLSQSKTPSQKQTVVSYPQKTASLAKLQANKPSSPSSSAYQMSMVANSSDMQLRTERQKVDVPAPKPSFQAIPLVPQMASNGTKKPASTSSTTTQSFDLNRDGTSEHVIQTPMSDGHINISVVSEGKEIMFAKGQQLQILPTRRQGWSDLALINTATSQKQVYQFDTRTQEYVKTYLQPLRPMSVAQRNL